MKSGPGILPKPQKWTYYYLYVILDIFSRYVVGWMVAHRELSALAKKLIEGTCEKQMIQRGQLLIHATILHNLMTHEKCGIIQYYKSRASHFSFSQMIGCYSNIFILHLWRRTFELRDLIIMIELQRSTEALEHF